MIKIEVPASTSNLGCGFDAVGMALNIKNTFVFKKANTYQVTNFSKEYDVNNNLVIKAYKEVFQQLNKPEIQCEVILEKQEIPISRGLGSSSSCIIAGIFAANHFLGNILSKEECLQLAINYEGHPDNIAPSILGGLVTSYCKEDKIITTNYQINPSLLFFCLIPNFTIETKMARQALPKSLGYKDIVHSLGRAINLPHAFNIGDIDLIRDVFDDRLHEPYRYPLIPQAIDIKNKLLLKAAALCISGSGPTLFVVTKHPLIIDEMNFENWNVLPVKVDYQGVMIWED